MMIGQEAHKRPSIAQMRKTPVIKHKILLENFIAWFLAKDRKLKAVTRRAYMNHVFRRLHR